MKHTLIPGLLPVCLSVNAHKDRDLLQKVAAPGRLNNRFVADR